MADDRPPLGNPGDWHPLDPSPRRTRKWRERNLGRSIGVLSAWLMRSLAGWSLPASDEDTREILKAALGSAGSEVRPSLEAVIQRLGARGHWVFHLPLDIR
jgi:hypothetical protein